MEALYSKGIFTGLALIVEMIERGEHGTLDELADHLRGMYQGKLTDRDKLVLNHGSAMHRTLNLPKNTEKGDWKGLSPYKLLALAEIEMSELSAAVWGFCNGEPAERVESEAADLSNFAAMIADNCKRQEA